MVLVLRDRVVRDKGCGRVVRGGAWNNNTENCRSAYRNNRHPQNRNNNQGFRLLCFSSHISPTFRDDRLCRLRFVKRMERLINGAD
ncbi:SUMF1/EgtB/PvdO family nonheme iron enzyme [Leucothrix pacifica]|uniref:SUMF1/EgtB/PvdO family nonheme iron enzyme n=1 Tax=Leucothrix pacifica TaxID=1247513 RepID=UPI003CCC7B43